MSPQDIVEALDGDGQTMTALMERLLPLVQSEVGYALQGRARIQNRDLRQDLLDFMQEIVVDLLENDGKILRSWDPGRGRSFDSFVRLVVRRRVNSILRGASRNPWRLHRIGEFEAETVVPDTAPATSPEHHTAESERLQRILEYLDERLDERGKLFFRLLYVEERTVQEVCARTQTTREAIYAWRNRLKRMAKQLDSELCGGEKP